MLTKPFYSLCPWARRIVEIGTFQELLAKEDDELKRLHHELGETAKDAAIDDTVPPSSIASVEAAALEAVEGQLPLQERQDDSPVGEPLATAIAPPTPPSQPTPPEVDAPAGVTIDNSTGEPIATETPTAGTSTSGVKLSASKSSKRKSITAEIAADNKDQEKKDAGKLVQAEGITTGYVKWSVYTGYFSAVGPLAAVGAIVGIALSIGASMAASIWLAIWSKAGATANAKSPQYYIGVYVGLSFAQVIITLLSTFSAYGGKYTSLFSYANIVF